MKMQWKIGNVEIPNPFVLAPMAGVTDLAFRRLCKEQGAGLICMEMVSAKAISFHNKNTEALMEIDPGEHPVSMQLFGSEPDLMAEVAKSIEERPFDILDINMGMNGIDEKEMMKQVIYEVSSTVDCPLCIDTSHIDVMEEALRIYPGRALINSISLESEKIEKMLPIAKKYGAMFVLLPLSDEGLPKDGEEKKHIIETVYDRAMEMGMAHEDIVVDGLVATIGANPEAARECYETIAYCKDVRKLPTICGLSNISFGLPERMYVNTAFLTMAICEGLTMAIANPSQELLMNAAFASDMLLHRPDSDI